MSQLGSADGTSWQYRYELLDYDRFGDTRIKNVF